MKERLWFMDNLRGFMTLLVILGHVTLGLAGYALGSFADANLQQKITTVIYAFHMPVFFSLSGYFWKAKKSIGIRERIQNIINKLIALGIPYFICSIVYFAFKYLLREFTAVDISYQALVNIPIYPIEFFWYLYSLCTIYVFSEVFTVLHIDKKVLAIIFAVVSIGGFVTTQEFSLWNTCRHAVYFYIGSIIADNIKHIASRKCVLFTGMGAIGFLYIYLYDICENSDIIRFILCVFMACFLIGSFSIFANKECKYLTYIGKQAMPFYIMHIMFVGGTRIMLWSMDVYDMTIHTILGFFLTIIGCYVLYYYVISKVGFLDFCFYPSKYFTNRKVS